MKIHVCSSALVFVHDLLLKWFLFFLLTFLMPSYLCTVSLSFCTSSEPDLYVASLTNKPNFLVPIVTAVFASEVKRVCSGSI